MTLINKLSKSTDFLSNGVRLYALFISALVSIIFVSFTRVASMGELRFHSSIREFKYRSSITISSESPLAKK